MNRVAPKRTNTGPSEEQIARNREALHQADANNRIEGIYRSPDTDAIFEALVRGEIDTKQALARIKALDAHP
jgi:hypothetical protein